MKRERKSKAKAKQTAGMRSRRKPVKPGDRGQTSQIHITKRSYKSSRGGVSVDPEKINPSLTIQGHRHGTHGGQSRSNNKATRTKSTSIIQGGGGVQRIIKGGTRCVSVVTHTHICTHTLIAFTPFPSHTVEGGVFTGISGARGMKYQNPSVCSCELSHYKRLTRLTPPTPCHTRTHTHWHPRSKLRGLPHTGGINNQQAGLFIITYWCMYMRGVSLEHDWPAHSSI